MDRPLVRHVPWVKAQANQLAQWIGYQKDTRERCDAALATQTTSRIATRDALPSKKRPCYCVAKSSQTSTRGDSPSRKPVSNERQRSALCWRHAFTGRVFGPILQPRCGAQVPLTSGSKVIFRLRTRTITSISASSRSSASCGRPRTCSCSQGKSTTSPVST